jgi:uncharacterized protein YbaP (TraB family)
MRGTYAPVAQLDRVLPSEGKGHTFESCRVRHFPIFCAFVGLALTACGPAPADPVESAAGGARPALWQVSDADTTVYLFGTIHMLPQGLSWQTPVIAKALGEAQAVYLEADVEGDPREIGALVDSLGRLPPGETLSSKLQPQQRQDLLAAAGKLRLAPAALETMRPWLAAVTLADAAVRDAGYSTGAGVEAAIRSEARRAGKEERFLESVEQQLSALANLPEDVQLAWLDFTAADIDGAAASLRQMVDAWIAGDTDGLARLLIEDDIARLPALKEALLTHRNSGWARQIDIILDNESGTVFMAVGAAHLVGEDSVQAQLTTRGHTAARVE